MSSFLNMSRLEGFKIYDVCSVFGRIGLSAATVYGYPQTA